MTSEHCHRRQQQSLPPQLVDPSAAVQALRLQCDHRDVLAKVGSWCEKVIVQQVERQVPDPVEELDACRALPYQNAEAVLAAPTAEGQNGQRLQHDPCQLMGTDPERCEEVPV